MGSLDPYHTGGVTAGKTVVVDLAYYGRHHSNHGLCSCRRALHSHLAGESTANLRYDAALQNLTRRLIEWDQCSGAFETFSGVQ